MEQKALAEMEKEAFAPIEEAIEAGELRAEAEVGIIRRGEATAVPGWMPFNPEFLRQ